MQKVVSMKAGEYGVLRFFCMVCGFQRNYFEEEEVLEACPECGVKTTTGRKADKKT